MQWKSEKRKTKRERPNASLHILHIQAKHTCPPLLNALDEATPKKQEEAYINRG